jgi:hypothetical protein
MSDMPGSDHELEDLFREMTQNLKKLVQAIWTDPALQSAQSEFLESLEAMRKGLEASVEDFADSEAGQRFQQDLKELNRKIQTGELEEKVRDEMVRGLRKANQELTDLANRQVRPDSSSPTPPDPGGSRPPSA